MSAHLLSFKDFPVSSCFSISFPNITTKKQYLKQINLYIYIFIYKTNNSQACCRRLCEKKQKSNKQQQNHILLPKSD